ncbi:MAG: hypothetical protein ACOC80_08040 [Petrotogales bacterium]
MKYNRKLLISLYNYYNKEKRCLWEQINIPDDEDVYDDMVILRDYNFIEFVNVCSNSSSGSAYLIDKFRITKKGKTEINRGIFSRIVIIIIQFFKPVIEFILKYLLHSICVPIMVSIITYLIIEYLKNIC